MTTSTNAAKKIRRMTWLAFTAVILIAFFFRFYRLADYPLGIFFDPAINGLDALRLMQRGRPVLFFPTNGGREALFMYLLIPFIWLFDTIPFTLRALTAAISLLNVALLIGFLNDLRPYDSKNPITQIRNPQSAIRNQFPWLAFFAGLVLATSYWHISISRLGQRPILVPMLAVPVFWFFLKGWRSGQKRWFIISGVLLGVEGYTYSAARLLPVILGLALLPEFILRPAVRSNFKQVITNLALFTLSALLIYAPMAWYLLNHPAQFTARAFSVMVWNFLNTPADIIAELGRNLLRVAAFFCCTGSPNPIFGFPGYPGLPLLLAPFLIIGLGITLKNWPDFFHRLILLWWAIGIFPSIIAIEAPHPLRMIVALPPTAILTGLGLCHFADWLQVKLAKRLATKNVTHTRRKTKDEGRRQSFVFRLSSFIPPTAKSQESKNRLIAQRLSLSLSLSLGLTLLLILLPLPGLYRAYFIEWGSLEATQGIYDYGAIAIRDAILEQSQADVPIYLPQARFNDSTLLFYLGGRFERRAALSAPPAEAALLIAPEKNRSDASWVRLYRQTATVLPPFNQEGRQVIEAALAGEASSPIKAANGETVAHQVRLPLDPVAYVEQPTFPIQATFGPLALTGATYPQQLDPQADAVPVTLFWQAVAPTPNEYEILVRLVNDERRALGNGDARPTDWVYPTSFWRPNLDDIAARHSINIEPEMLDPGRYWLAVSVFDPALRQRLPLRPQIAGSPDTLFIGPLKAPLPPPEPLPPLTATPGQVIFGDILELTGYELDHASLTPGESIQLQLLWRTLAPPERDYTVFVHLLDSEGNLVAGNDSLPLAGRYPTSIWTPGEQILDVHTLQTPDRLAEGDYQLAVGLYYQPTGARLPIFSNGARDEQGRLILEPPVKVRVENALDHN